MKSAVGNSARTKIFSLIRSSKWDRIAEGGGRSDAGNPKGIEFDTVSVMKNTGE